MFIVIGLSLVETLPVIHRNVKDPVIAGAVHIVQHLFVSLLRDLRRPHVGEAHVALAVGATVRRIRTVDGHTNPTGLPIVKGTGDPL